MPKKWKIKNKDVSVELIKQHPEINPVVLQLLSNRGFSIEQIKNFLKPDYVEHLHDPFLFRDMQKIVELIKKYLEDKKKIVIYGDYDADGVTGTALLFKTLEFLCTCPASKLLAGQVDIYLPDRSAEGYGLNKEAIEKIAKDGAKLIITVDNGIRNVKEVKLARELGMEVIVTDHHECGDELPDCLILDPKVEGEEYPYKELAGVGVAFKLAQALLRTNTKETKKHERNEFEAFEKWLLDLVAIGTVADCVPLLDENRVLVKYGLKVLNKTQRTGLKKLIEVAQSAIDRDGNIKEIDAWQIGFQLAPRLNAAGRLDHANSAYQLLVTDSKNEAIEIAKELDKQNKERQQITNEIFEFADQRVNPDDSSSAKAMDDKKILFAVWPGLLKEPLDNSRDPSASLRMTKEMWPAGVMGLVSGKLTEKYYRPSLAITQKGGPAQANSGAGKEIVGSGRSVEEFDITEMLEECAEFLENFGGHKQACGFTLTPFRHSTGQAAPIQKGEGERKEKTNLEKFLEKSKEVAERKLKDIDLTPTINIDLKIDFKDIDEKLYEALQKLRPFGQNNPQPKFVSENISVFSVFNMGSDEQHLKLKIQNGGTVLSAVGFSVPEEWKNVKVGDKVDLVYYIDMNEWNRRKEIQLKIVDLKIK